MHVIEQKLVVKDWPLKKPGDELFFGYIVALGVFPGGDWEGDQIFPYADFAYGDTYSRFRLPYDDGLLEQLQMQLADNLEILAASGSIAVKLWIQLTEKGYKVDLP
jgi:hypothetical protein